MKNAKRSTHNFAIRLTNLDDLNLRVSVCLLLFFKKKKEEEEIGKTEGQINSTKYHPTLIQLEDWKSPCN